MSRDRFEKLEPGLPSETDAVLARWTRFERLEIAGVTAAPPAPQGQFPCGHCGRANEPERDHCWACYKPLTRPPAPPATGESIKIVVNGVPYHSTDPHLPADIRELMARVRREGLTPEALHRWAASRGGTVTSAVETGGPRLSVRVDGRVYRDGDPGLPPHVRELLNHLRRHDASPALLDALRTKGAVTLRPPSTVAPSDGDIAFWSSVSEAPAVSGIATLWRSRRLRFSVGVAIVLYFLTRILR